MEEVEAKAVGNQPIRRANKNLSVVASLCLRVAAAVFALTAAWLMLTNKQSTMLFAFIFEASYSSASAFVFFAYANLVACILSALSLCLLFLFSRRANSPTNYFYMFLLDLVMMTLLMSACAAATAIGYVGQYGYSNPGWMPICDKFDRFCKRATVSILCSYVSFVCGLFLTIISANHSRQIQVQS